MSLLLCSMALWLPNAPFTRERRRGAAGATELLVGVQRCACNGAPSAG